MRVVLVATSLIAVVVFYLEICTVAICDGKYQLRVTVNPASESRIKRITCSRLREMTPRNWP